MKAKDSSNSWEQAQHFVLFLDIMGFKDRVEKTSLNELRDSLMNFKTKNKKLNPLLMDAKTSCEHIRLAQFSDSIVAVSESDTKDDLNRILKVGVILMQTALESQFALRGALSLGQMVFDKNNQLFFGKALVDAYLLEESLNCYGIVLHESVEEIVSSINNSNGYDASPDKTAIKGYKYYPIHDCELPFKGGKSRHYHIAWYAVKKNLTKGFIGDESKKWLQVLRRTVSGNPRVYLDNTIRIINEYEKLLNPVPEDAPDDVSA